MTRPNGNAQRNPYVVQPVFKALKVLEYVARQGHDVTLTEVASELALPKTTAFRYLQTLTVAAFLSHDQAHDRYGLGSRFHALANADTSLRRLRDVAHPMMEDLGRSFNETINLGVLDGLNRIIDITVPRDKSEGGTYVIPGHGRLADEADVVDYRDMATIVHDRVRDAISRKMSLEQVKAARLVRDYEGRFGASQGAWTTDAFIEAAYRSLSPARPAAGAR